jgi:hypothetical protein
VVRFYFRIFILFFVYLLVSREVFAVAASASSHRLQSVKEIYQNQCALAGGAVNGFCMCEKKQDLLVLASTVVSAAQDLKNVKQKAFNIINPFVESCNNTKMDLAISMQKLNELHRITLTYTAQTDLQEEMFVLDELDLFHPDSFSRYMSNAHFKQNTKLKINKMKTTQQNLLNKGVTGTLRSMAQEKSKMLAIAGIQEFTEINITQARLINAQVQQVVANFVEKSSSKSMALALKEMGTEFITKSAKAAGKGFVAGLIMTAGLEAVSYSTGIDLSAYDPFAEIFGATPAGDGTISGALNQKVSMTLYPEFKDSLDMGFYTNPELFSAKLVMMGLMAESRAQGKTVFGFLD